MDFQESSPRPQLKSINSSVLRLLYGPALVSYMTITELRALTKEFPKPSQDSVGFTKEFELTIRIYDPGYSDLYQLKTPIRF